MKTCKLVLVLTLTAAATVSLFSTLTDASEASLGLPAFPGAEGFGAQALGGRGGEVIEVTNLNDSGAGSLRAALTAPGPRIVVFRTGGTITLLSQIKISNPYITIAGQTAPGGGITLRNDPSNTKAPIQILTHDVVIRYIRSRPGSSTALSSDLDALDIDSGYNIIVDHSSFSWATDEDLSTGYSGSLPRPHDVTIQWSIIAEALNTTQLPGKGTLINEGSNNISLHHNLYAQNLERNPRIKTNGIVDIVNNVIYNPGFTGTWGPSHSTPVGTDKNRINYVGNYYKPGVNSGTANHYVSAEGPADIFLQDNFVPHDVIRSSDTGWVVGTRHLAAALATTSPQDAYQQVLDKAGAIYPVRDTVDQRIINDVRNGTGKIIADPSQVGGWPNIAAGTPPLDGDHDGMPDDWELLHGLNPMNSSDGPQDADSNGYTNVEEYLNETDSLVVGSGTNQAPSVTAGADQSITLPNGATLSGTVSDDGLPSGSLMTTAWSQISGPGTVIFTSPNTEVTVANFSAAGSYTLRLTANDSLLDGFDDVIVTVNAAGDLVNMLEVRVSASTDDAEQSSTGSVDLVSSDLELVLDSSIQTVGMRFNAIAIPSGATITNAYLQFKVDETSSTTTALQIFAQADDNPSTFTTATGNISSRTKTAASVSWNPAAWPTVGEAGADQRPPDLKAVIQEIVNRQGWASNNSLAIIITGTGTGKRTAEAFNGDQAGAPKLHIEYSTGTTSPAAFLSPTNLSFADQLVGSTSTAQTVTLSNSGDMTLDISIVANGDFAQFNDCPAILAPTYDCTISVTFIPTVSGARSGAVTVIDNVTGNPQAVVTLSGNGVTGASPIVAISAPDDNSTFTPNNSITFTGSASDTEDGDLATTLSWNSNISGAIGTGETFSYALPLGVHTITATATDSNGNKSLATITVTVNE